MPERRYSDEEIAAIFKRAAETEPTASPVLAEGQGMTLAALQEIGREVGISPESISQAARSLETTGRPASRNFIGFPIAVGRTIQLERPLSDADWGLLVTDMRETFSARGKLKSDGPFRQWTNGNLQALIEPTPGGERLRLQTLAGGPRSLMRSGIIMFALGASALVALRLTGALDALRLTGVLDIVPVVGGAAFVAAMGLGMFAIGALPLRGWARRRSAQIEAVMARLAARTSPPEGGR
jgi:hypothetical protein